MSSWDKVVKGATKSKTSPPKAKYIDPIISASNTSDGTLLDIFRALQVRLKDANSVVVFKSLIVVHTLVRSGNRENVLGYLSGSKILGLEQVVSGHDTAQNLNKYAVYLDRRIRTYGALKYDIIRDKAEKRGDQEDIKGCNRLRFLTVDKGLLRETTLLQKQMDTLADCKFYTDDLDDDVVMTALRLCVKDLLLIFQAVNEGVINVLEHYFEMSHPDATTALKIYKRFCMQTEKVVAYLSIAKKMQNVINVPIPNLKHAPISLAKSLEEYLNDPNFEKNREEYKQNKAIADGKAPPPKTETQTPSTKPESNGTSAKPTTPLPVDNQDFLDFFSSIEQEQQPMFPQPGMQQQFFQPPPNPFLTHQMTGMPFGGQQMALAPQITGFAPGGLQPNPFLQQQPTGYNPFMQQPQQTGFVASNGPFGGPINMMAAQNTGLNPFRHSISLPPSASMPMLSNAPTGMPTSPFGTGPMGHRASYSTASALPPVTSLFGAPPTPFGSANNQPGFTPTSASSSAAILGAERTSSSSPAPIAAQQTGSRNPFAPPPGTQSKLPPQPTGPSLHQLAFNSFQAAQMPQSNGQQLFGGGGDAASTSAGSAAPPTRQLSMPMSGLMSSVASSFTINDRGPSPSGLPPSASPVSATSAGPGGPYAQANGTNPMTAPLQQQRTGYGGSLVKPFKPTSSFGTSLAESLPPIPEPVDPQQGGHLPNPFRSATLPANFSLSSQATGVSQAGNGNFGTSPFGAGLGANNQSSFMSSQPTGYSLASQPFGTPGQHNPAVGNLI